MKTILRYLLRYMARFIAALGTKTVAAFMDLIIPWVLAYIIDSVIPTRSVPLVCIWGVSC